MTTIPIGPSKDDLVKQYVLRKQLREQQQLREQLPAFSTSSDILYALEIPGLTVSITLDPCERVGFKMGEVKQFVLNYDPAKFLPGSLIRRALGTQKLTYTDKDVRCYGKNTVIIDMGDVLEVFLKHPKKDTTHIEDDGPLMIISREDERIYFYPPDTDVDSPTPGRIISGLLSETQQHLGKHFKGKWMKIHDSNGFYMSPALLGGY